MKIYIWDSKRLDLVRINWIWITTLSIISILLISTTSYLAFLTGKVAGKTEKITESDVVILYMDAEKNSFSKRSFYEYLKKINIKFPELVFAQAVKESGFSSRLWKENNNPFGMKEAPRRANKQNGQQSGYAYYDSWKDACIDYAFYQTHIGLSKIKTREEYLMVLKEMNYFDTSHPGNSNYLEELRKISENIDSYLD